MLLKEDSINSNDKSELLRIIIEDGDKGVALLRRLSRFSRNREPKFEPADINAIIEDAIGLTWPVVRYSKMTIEKIFDSDMPSIIAIKDQLQEVFVAMILNALDAIVEKGTLKIQTNYYKEENTIEILLSDTGVGIKSEYLNKIEDPFFTTKGQQKRLGIGLAISREIILKHKVSLKVKSVQGKGTAFTVRLPVKE